MMCVCVCVCVWVMFEEKKGCVVLHLFDVKETNHLLSVHHHHQKSVLNRKGQKGDGVGGGGGPHVTDDGWFCN